MKSTNQETLLQGRIWEQLFFIAAYTQYWQITMRKAIRDYDEGLGETNEKG